ncbi:hypothetical protein FTO70_03770 [Methanosarcina sp. KYL-1]|uniref:hypothetical protein n=1 Tax=Methanosarcina sp. KYL-1 TaxID=2602068 RepID=UPI0021012654|nr:hypothetical protein [Methanosarcina sp. KYL-1]MCQ1534821.1 hypothetical protein [Methanosarcina sp. KYL-1]
MSNLHLEDTASKYVDAYLDASHPVPLIELNRNLRALESSRDDVEKGIIVKEEALKDEKRKLAAIEDRIQAYREAIEAIRTFRNQREPEEEPVEEPEGY